MGAELSKIYARMKTASISSWEAEHGGWNVRCTSLLMRRYARFYQEDMDLSTVCMLRDFDLFLRRSIIKESLSFQSFAWRGVGVTPTGTEAPDDLISSRMIFV